MSVEHKQMILFFGLSKARINYFKRMTAGELYLENVPFAKDVNWSEYSFDRYINHLRYVLSTTGSELTTPENWQKFSYEWPYYTNPEYRNWPLWKEYYDHTQADPKNRFTHLYKGMVAKPYFLMEAYLKKYTTDDYGVLKLPTNQELGRYIYSELSLNPNAKLGEHHYGFAKEGNTYLPVFHTIRGSKIGINIAKTNPNVTIYFLLDGLDMKKVLTKTRLKMPAKNVTNHELRYIYRNWSQLEGKIIFFRDGKEVEPPWKSAEYKKMWQAYNPKCFQKNNWIRRKWADFRKKKDIPQKKENSHYSSKVKEQKRAFADIQQQLIQELSARQKANKRKDLGNLGAGNHSTAIYGTHKKRKEIYHCKS